MADIHNCYLADVLHSLNELILNFHLKVDAFPGETILHPTTRRQCLTAQSISVSK